MFLSAVDPALLDVPYRPKGFGGTLETSILALDLYVCCQCQLFLIASSVLQPSIPESIWNAFLEERRRILIPKTTLATRIVSGLKALHVAIQSTLWREPHRSLKTNTLSFKRRFGAFTAATLVKLFSLQTPLTEAIFEFIGFFVQRDDNGDTLFPGPTDRSSLEGLQNRAKMLRIWVGLGAFLAHFIAENRQEIDLRRAHAEAPFWVHLTEHDRTRVILGNQPFHTPSFDLSTLDDLTWDLLALGFRPADYSPTLLAFAYLAQCRCNPKKSVEYFSLVCDIEADLRMKGFDTSSLTLLITRERSRGRFTLGDVRKAALTLGLSDVLHFLFEDGNSQFDAVILPKLILSAWASVYQSLARFQRQKWNNVPDAPTKHYEFYLRSEEAIVCTKYGFSGKIGQCTNIPHFGKGVP
ncbi:hypothetical protein DL96DRAFT_533899 [Flagelloscypha sp. PMI_526]|nr:hypothetical protein DL96DRAFT_533899 [Flagelloscypha sp. PMI_526]